MLVAKAGVDHSVVNDASKLLEVFSVGDVSHQGDVIVVGIAKLPSSAQRRANRQVADGNTQGSRHILENGELYDCDKTQVAKAIKEVTKCIVDERYIGPVFVSPDVPTADDLTHPEHGNQGFPAGQVCAIVYQRSLDAEQREQRVRD